MNETIPYIDKPHPLTGMTNARLGTWLFIASEVMLFGSLFSALIMLKVGAANWPIGRELLNIGLGTINTLILISSSIAIRSARRALSQDRGAAFKFAMVTNLFLGLVFLWIKYTEYAVKFEHGLLPSTNNFFAVYFLFTGLHALHIIAGLGVNTYLLIWPTKERVACAELYWHFLDAVWACVFVSLYLL